MCGRFMTTTRKKRVLHCSSTAPAPPPPLTSPRSYRHLLFVALELQHVRRDIPGHLKSEGEGQRGGGGHGACWPRPANGCAALARGSTQATPRPATLTINAKPCLRYSLCSASSAIMLTARSAKMSSNSTWSTGRISLKSAHANTFSVPRPLHVIAAPPSTILSCLGEGLGVSGSRQSKSRGGNAATHLDATEPVRPRFRQLRPSVSCWMKSSLKFRTSRCSWTRPRACLLRIDDWEIGGEGRAWRVVVRQACGAGAGCASGGGAGAHLDHLGRRLGLVAGRDGCCRARADRGRGRLGGRGLRQRARRVRRAEAKEDRQEPRHDAFDVRRGLRRGDDCRGITHVGHGRCPSPPQLSHRCSAHRCGWLVGS